VRPADVLILTRYKKHLDIYARALEERGIPFEITGSAAFAESEEIGEITKLAMALNDPENPILALAVLRGIFFGVSDAHLLEFKREGGRFNFALPGKDVLQSKKLGAVYVSMALAKLREWRKWTLELPVSAALQKIFEDSGILNFYASLEMGSSRVGNVLKLLEMVRNQERRGATAFARIVRFMEELAEVREIEELSLTPARTNAVRLMNLHKAKGLEAPIVFLADPSGIKDHEVEKHIIRVGTLPEGTPLDRGGEAIDGRPGPLGFFVFKEGRADGKSGHYQRKILSQPAGWDEAAAEEEKYEAAEEIRLQYVAATRARNMLVISTYGGDMKNKAWEALDAALDGVPELESAGEDRGERVREEVVISKAEVGRARNEITTGLKSASGPTYAVESVTSLAKKEREAPPRRRDTGLGLRWGRLVHQVLEAIGSGRLAMATVGADDISTRETKAKKDAVKTGVVGRKDRVRLELFVDNLLAAEESDFSDKERLIVHVESILESPFWERVVKCEKRYFEIPFSIRTSRGELAQLGARESAAGGRENLPVILTGSVDLVFWEEGPNAGSRGAVGRERSEAAGWVIADYKTDKIPIADSDIERVRRELGSERIRAISPEFAGAIDFYAPQVRLYRRFWQQITGEPVKESGLYFTSIGAWVPV
jgi:ATP-dependent helicase/nuclease subunit A